MRDNIFASSSHYDRLSHTQAPAEQEKKKKIGEPIQVDKSSVAFQRGKRSCTQLDIQNFKPQSVMSQLKAQGLIDGKKSVGGKLGQDLIK